MTEGELIDHILERLISAESGLAVFGADEICQWPDSALDSLVKAKVLLPAQPAEVLECDGCERNCFMPVYVRPGEGGQAARAFISCDKPEDYGRIPVELWRLERWHVTGEILAGAVIRMLGLKSAPQPGTDGKRWMLGRLKGAEGLGAMALVIENVATLDLTAAGLSVPLAGVLTLDRRGLGVDKVALLRALGSDTRRPMAGIGSPTWRKQKAKAAADARHGRAGGSRDIQRKMQAIWASGKYTSRDRCAEEECAALGISMSTARKALRNTPEPKRA